MKAFMKSVLCILLCMMMLCATGCSPAQNPESTPRVSGIWAFVDAPSTSSTTHTHHDYDIFSRANKVYTTENVSFFLPDGSVYSSISFGTYTAAGAIAFHPFVQFDGKAAYNSIVSVFGETGTGWHDPSFQTINFGPDAQTVSKEFYDWLCANAAPVLDAPAQ